MAKNIGVPKKITAAQMNNDMRGRKKLRRNRAGGSGQEFPFRVAKVTQVDAKKMTCSLYVFTGNGDPYEDIPLTFGAAGARHFMGAIPEVNDLCVIGYSPMESGFTRKPYIVGWLVPGTEVGYDWAMTSPTGEDELPLTPEIRHLLRGSMGRRRHKLRQMESGNVVASSSQGSDMILDESVLLTNRRGNELILRDQDQALITRTLQTFHAGAGVRTYSGMVQRDSSLLPTQVVGDGSDWGGTRQVDEEGAPLPPDALDDLENYGDYIGSTAVEDYHMPGLNPRTFLRRGLYVDSEGKFYDRLTKPDAVYGGKAFHRVSTDTTSYDRVNSVLDPGTTTFSEWRVEVAHASDGTLPVTEQTDGIDIERLLPTSPKSSSNGTGDESRNNTSAGAPYVSMVLGTAVGNDPVKDRNNYGMPLVPQMFDQNGDLAPTIRAAGDAESPTEHAAFLVRVQNPYDLTQPEAFMGITKGGAFRSYFPGSGSNTHQQYFQTGILTQLGADDSGESQICRADGTLDFKSYNGRPLDNAGIILDSVGGGVKIQGGGAFTDDDGGYAVKVESKTSSIIKAQDICTVTAQTISLRDADVISETANNAITVNAGETITHNTKSYNVVSNGAANYTLGGPKDGLFTNGPLRKMDFTGGPLTGVAGGAVDKMSINYGGISKKSRNGKFSIKTWVGSVGLSTNSPDVPKLPFCSQGASISSGIAIGPISVNKNSVSAKWNAVKAEAVMGTATLNAKAGATTVSGTALVTVKSTGIIRLKSGCLVQVATGGLSSTKGLVMTDGCRNPLTGRAFRLSGTLGSGGFIVT